MIKHSSALLLIIGLTAGNLLSGQQLPLPPSDGSLSCSGIDEYLETFRIRRLEFSGTIEFQGDPPQEFYASARSEDGCALQFQHIYDSETKVQFWIYPNAGSTEFNAETWNRFLKKSMEKLPARFAAVIEQPFEDGYNTGPPILGYISLSSTTVISEPSSGSKSWVRLYLVPVMGSNKVMVMSLQTKDQHLSYMNPLFEAFARGLFLAGGAHEGA